MKFEFRWFRISTVIESQNDDYGTLKKKDAILNQREFRGLKKDFVYEGKLKNSFVHSTKPEKGFDS
jgi:hypothetical protein